jgi:hypothetical protein
MALSDQVQHNFITRKPLLTYFVFSYIFFWLFLALFVVALNVFHLKLETIPSWLMPLVTVLGSWTPTRSHSGDWRNRRARRGWKTFPKVYPIQDSN